MDDYSFWLERAEQQREFGNEDMYLKYRQRAEEYNPESLKRVAEERENAKRRRLELKEAEDAADEIERQVLNRDQVDQLDIGRMQRRIERQQQFEMRAAETPLTLDITYFLRTAKHLAQPDHEWLQQLYPWITVGQAPPTHRIYTNAMQCFCLASDATNRGALLKRIEQSLEERNWLKTSMIQELMFDQTTIMPFFDLEPDIHKFDEACPGNVGGPSFMQIFEMVASLFPEWPALSWIVWYRNSPTGPRFHIRVRGLKGECVLVSRNAFQHKAINRRLKPLQGVKIPTRDWLGLDKGPYNSGQMRMSIGTKCTPKALGEMRVSKDPELYTYHVKSVWVVERGKVKQEASFENWPYQPESLWGAGALAWNTGELIRPTRIPNPSIQEIVLGYQTLTSRLPDFGIPQHEHLSPATFSWNWRPRTSLRTALLGVDSELPKEEVFDQWKRIANHYCRVIQRNGVQVLVLTPQPPAPQDADRRKRVICDNDQYRVEVQPRQKFVTDFSQFKKEWAIKVDGKTHKQKCTFSDVVLGTLDVSIDSMMWRQWPMQNPDSRNFNLWCGPGVTPDASIKWVMENRRKAKMAVRLFLEHLMWLCGNRHKNPKVDRYNMWAFTVLLHFTRKVLVDPFDRHQWEYILIMQGEPGCGKGTYWKLLQALVSFALTFRVEGDASASRQMETFNAQFARHLLTLLDEPSQLPMTLVNSFKTLATEAQTGQEEKYDKNEMGQNLAHVMIFFNRLKKLPQLDQGERRIIITEGLNHPRKREFFDKVYEVLEGDKGYHAIACYLYTLEANPKWESTMGSTPYTGPLKAMMFDQSKPTISLLLSNAKSLAWYRDDASEMLYRPEPLEDAPSAWRNYLEIRPHEEFNYWIWRTMGEGFECEWPPFVPLSMLVKLLWGAQRVNPKMIAKIQADLNENLKSIWPTYVSETWPNHPVYARMEPVMDLSDLMAEVRALEFRDSRVGYIHRNCHVPDIGTCCAQTGWSEDVWQWHPWHEKIIKLEKMSGKVLLLPRKADAENFYLQLFSTISDIPSVHFPRNWQIGRWDAFVDALGSDGGVAPLDGDDEEEYFNFEGVELGPSTGDRS